MQNDECRMQNDEIADSAKLMQNRKHEILKIK